jgi:hypothetical protein
MKLDQCLLVKDTVFRLDSRIRYFGFLDNRSGMIVSELRSQDSIHHPEEQLVRDLTFFKGAMSSWGLYFGHVNYSIVVHDHFKIVLIPVESGLAIFTSDANLPVEKAEEIAAKVVDEFSFLSKL